MMIIAGAAAALLVVGVTGYVIGQSGGSSCHKCSRRSKPLYWVAPMDPSYRRDKPGNRPWV